MLVGVAQRHLYLPIILQFPGPLSQSKISLLLPLFPAAQQEWLVSYSGQAEGQRIANEKLLPSNNLHFLLYRRLYMPALKSVHFQFPFFYFQK